MQKFIMNNSTFRMSVVLYVWDEWFDNTVKYIKKEFIDMWINDEQFEYMSEWQSFYVPDIWEIIWMKSFDLWTLVHELLHAVQHRLEDCWVDDCETQAYLLQDLFTTSLNQIWISKFLDSNLHPNQNKKGKKK